jgi:hypothetical protein
VNESDSSAGSPPLLQPNSEGLSENDLNSFLWSITRIREILNGAPLSSKIEKELLPGKHLSESQLKQWVNAFVFFFSPFVCNLVAFQISENYFTAGNWVGSVPMGKETEHNLNDKNHQQYPVDEAFRIRGVKGLSVAGEN